MVLILLEDGGTKCVFLVGGWSLLCIGGLLGVTSGVLDKDLECVPVSSVGREN